LDVLSRTRTRVPEESRTRLDLHEATLQRADLQEATLQRAVLQEANLRDTTVNEEQIGDTLSLQGATMPDGQKYEDWLKGEEGHKEDDKNKESSGPESLTQEGP
jgi:hypothetical protein